MNEVQTYDLAIIGGGLAGLATAIQLGKKGYKVVLFEKEKFPFHKVCGEYISLESWNFLESIGLPLKDLDLPIIRELHLTSPGGNSLTTKLPLGGFGISRYLLDSMLAGIAKEAGVALREEARVDEVQFGDSFTLTYTTKGAADRKVINATLCAAAYGKRSNLDVKWNRDFIQNSSRRFHNYVGVKYHVRGNWPHDTIGLHNFEGGYCGISKIEGDLYCLCYMTGAHQLKRFNGNLRELEEGVLYKNPFLKRVLQGSAAAAQFPITISQINFEKKAPVERGLLLLGDAAGTIPPLCGNGMSMALHSSKLAAGAMEDFLSGRITRGEMEELYQASWNRAFRTRLRVGRTLQPLFGRRRRTDLFVSLLKRLPLLGALLIRQTHGKPF